MGAQSSDHGCPPLWLLLGGGEVRQSILLAEYRAVVAEYHESLSKEATRLGVTKPFLLLEDVAQLLSVKPEFVEGLRAAKKLACIKLGRRRCFTRRGLALSLLAATEFPAWPDATLAQAGSEGFGTLPAGAARRRRGASADQAADLDTPELRDLARETYERKRDR